LFEILLSGAVSGRWEVGCLKDWVLSKKGEIREERDTKHNAVLNKHTNFRKLPKKMK
jgi:hypothetical protein